MRNNLHLFISLMLLSSCATNFEEEKTRLLAKEDNRDLVNTFAVPKDEARNFKENVETPPVVNVHHAEIVKRVKQEIKPKKVIIKTLPIVPVKTEEFAYPSDFPESFKTYDTNSKKVWEKFKPLFYQGEQSILAISYLGVIAGYITVSSQNIIKIGDRDTYHYTARFKSRDAYRYFYWLDDSLETYIEKSSFLPIKYSLIQREKIQNVDDLQLFDFKKLKTWNWYKRVKEGANADVKEENYIPRYIQDSFSALQFTRGLPLIKGDKYDFPVVTRGKAWLLKIEVMGEEAIIFNYKNVNAILVKAETHFPGVLQKNGDINFWYSADPARRLLKFKAKVKLGSIYGELVDYKPGILLK